MSTQPSVNTEHIHSIDLLRGMDMLILVVIQPFLLALFSAWRAPAWLIYHVKHAAWTGFHAWDLVMPLFLFISGASLPFFIARHAGAGGANAALWFRLARRVIVLWILGMIIQGNLFDCNLETLRIFSNTLQAIAVGYVIAVCISLLPHLFAQISVTALLFVAYAIFMHICTIKLDAVPYGNGSFDIGASFAEGIDRLILGGFRDHATRLPGGRINFPSFYGYAWIVPSLMFGATVMLGAFSGQILRARRTVKWLKVLILALLGCALFFAGYLATSFEPIVKPLFTISFTLLAAGISTALLALFYFFFDVLNIRRGTGLIALFGTHALIIYTLGEYVMPRIRPYLEVALAPLETQASVAWFPLIVKSTGLVLIFLVLALLRYTGIHLRA